MFLFAQEFHILQEALLFIASLICVINHTDILLNLVSFLVCGSVVAGNLIL